MRTEILPLSESDPPMWLLPEIFSAFGRRRNKMNRLIFSGIQNKLNIECGMAGGADGGYKEAIPERFCSFRDGSDWDAGKVPCVILRSLSASLPQGCSHLCGKGRG